MMSIFHHSILILKEKQLLEIDENEKAGLKVRPSGAEGNRTPVQTYSSKAFYMLISLLLVGDEPEMNKPIHRLAGWS